MRGLLRVASPPLRRAFSRALSLSNPSSAGHTRDQLLLRLAQRRAPLPDREAVIDAVERLTEPDLVLNEADWVTAVSALGRVRDASMPVTVLRKMEARGQIPSE